jgi:hypothetical protein
MGENGKPVGYDIQFASQHPDVMPKRFNCFGKIRNGRVVSQFEIQQIVS